MKINGNLEINIKKMVFRGEVSKMSVKISDFIDIQQWEKLQDAVSKMVGVAIVLVDYRGKEISRKSGVQPFCKWARNNPDLSKLCEKCDARGAIEAVRLEKPFHYYCYFDIVDIAIPIIIDQEYLGALLGGQITLEGDVDELEKVLTVDNQNELMIGMEEIYSEIPIIKMDSLKKIEEVLTKLSEYILSQAIEKNDINQKYHSVLSGELLKATLKVPQIKKASPHVQDYLMEEFINVEQYQTKDQRLQLMLEIIVENRQEMYTLNKLSKLTRLSTGHLSKLFKMEFDESFSIFYRKLKIKWAKELLLETDKKISVISEELGYENPSYFIQSFKKVEGMTPLKYRKIQS